MSARQRWRNSPRGNRGRRSPRHATYGKEWTCAACGCKGNWGHHTHCYSCGKHWRTPSKPDSAWDKPSDVAKLIAGLAQAKAKEAEKAEGKTQNSQKTETKDLPAQENVPDFDEDEEMVPEPTPNSSEALIAFTL